MSQPDAWGITAGSEDLKQHTEVTSKEELDKVFSRKLNGITTGVTDIKTMQSEGLHKNLTAYGLFKAKIFYNVLTDMASIYLMRL